MCLVSYGRFGRLLVAPIQPSTNEIVNLLFLVFSSTATAALYVFLRVSFLKDWKGAYCLLLALLLHGIYLQARGLNPQSYNTVYSPVGGLSWSCLGLGLPTLCGYRAGSWLTCAWPFWKAIRAVFCFARHYDTGDTHPEGVLKAILNIYQIN